MENKLIIKGARENNLKNVSLEIPKNKLVVITGVSGSGKSSLAFDTIYAEGQRRYLESLSSYVRQFLGGNEKPDVDSIEGLSPAISIDQKTTSNNPRSTVGTITEIYDYLRLIFAKVGTSYCPNGHGPIETLTIKQIIDKIFQITKDNDKLQILAPIVENAKGSFKNEFEKLKKEGYLRIRVDKQVYSLDDEIEIEKNKFHNIEIIIDRIICHFDSDTRSRIYDAIENATKKTSGKVTIIVNEQEHNFNLNHSCSVCGFSIPELEPKLFSFNSPTGACPNCKGLGFTLEPDINKMIPDFSKSINEGGIDFFKNTMQFNSLDWQRFDSLLKYYKIDKDLPIEELTKKELELMMEGSDEPIDISLKSNNGVVRHSTDYVEGVLALVKRRYFETNSELARTHYGKYMSEKPCKVCKGKRLSKEALSVKIEGKDIIELTDMSIETLLEWFLNLHLDESKTSIIRLALKEIVDRLSFLQNVGLGYLTLSRMAYSLSGGELQRIRLATQIGSKLTGILYVLDEPSIGLHQKDNDKLIQTLKSIRDLGNSVIVVEHDLDTMREADYIIDVGPGAGTYGGEIVAAGTVEEIIKNPKSLTGKYLSNELEIPIPKSRRSGNGQKIILKGASSNNLKNVDLTIPLGKLVVVTGVSGSGKSTLINETLVAAINKTLFNPFTETGKYRSLVGHQSITKLINVSQEPIGRTPRSNPATYVGVFDDIRDLFASLPEAKARGYLKGRFSFNLPGGRCEKCQGDGVIKIEMHFLPDVYIKCDECNGRKYNEETLSIKYKGKSIYDVLEMSVDEACDFFFAVPNIAHKLNLMKEVGLGYLKLGTPAVRLSGGEAQRVKLAKFLQRTTNGNNLLVLDEPTTGLHTHDISNLIKVIDKIVNKGNTVIIIEHNLDLIKCADYIVDLGPDGGDGGGRIIATGTPEQVAQYQDISYTAKYLYKILYK